MNRQLITLTPRCGSDNCRYSSQCLAGIVDVRSDKWCTHPSGCTLVLQQVVVGIERKAFVYLSLALCYCRSLWFQPNRSAPQIHEQTSRKLWHGKAYFTAACAHWIASPRFVCCVRVVGKSRHHFHFWKRKRRVGYGSKQNRNSHHTPTSLRRDTISLP